MVGVVELVVNAIGEVRESTRTSSNDYRPASDFLSKSPRGAYTAFLTYHKRKAIPSLSFHVKRLKDSHNLITQRVFGKQCHCPLTGKENASANSVRTGDSAAAGLLGHLLKIAVFKAIVKLEGELHPAVSVSDVNTDAYECFIIAHIPLKCCADSQKSDDEHLGSCDEIRIRASRYKSEIGTIPAAVDVEARGDGRRNAVAKDSVWVVNRRKLERLRDPSCAETILVEETRAGEKVLLEGLTSNFFVVIEGKVWTANDGKVLNGYARQLVLRACKNLGIGLALKAPSLSDLSKFSCAFLTSTTKELVLIRSIRYEEAGSGKFKMVVLPSSSKGTHIVDVLREAVVKYREEELTRLNIQGDV